MVTQSQKMSFQPSSLGRDGQHPEEQAQGTPPSQMPCEGVGLGGPLRGSTPKHRCVTWPQACSFTPVLPSPPGLVVTVQEATPLQCCFSSTCHQRRSGGARECEPTSQDTRTLEKYGHLRDSNRAQTTYSPWEEKRRGVRI